MDFFLIFSPQIHNRNVKICQKLILKHGLKSNVRHLNVNIQRSHLEEAVVLSLPV